LETLLGQPLDFVSEQKIIVLEVPPLSRESMVIHANKSCNHILTCPACKRVGIIKPSVVFSTSNPNKIPCQCGDYIFRFEWRD
jgi:hypothetical protein